MSTKRSKILLKATLAVSLSSLMISTASAAAFQLWEQDASGVGDYHAGAIAGANNAATGYYNPAGLVNMKKPQISTGTVLVSTDIKFKGNETTTNLTPGGEILQQNTESGSAQAGGLSAVPNFHFATPLTKYLYFGFGITTPFGLQTDWSKNSVVRYSATKSAVKTINLSPSFGLDLTHGFSFGAGVDYQYLHGEFDEVVGNSAPEFAGNNQLSINKGQDWALGYHAGFLYQIGNHTHLGLSYRSRIIHHLKGSSTLTNITTKQREGRSGNVRSSITLPPTTMLGFYQKITPKFSMMGSTEYTQWNVITDLTLKNVSSVNNQKVSSTVPLHYKNTWNFALGGQYQLSNRWLIKSGAGYDVTPTTSKRDIRLPDGNHFALAVGTQFKPTKNLALDFGWTHLFIKKVKVDKTIVVVKNPGIVDEATTDGNVTGAADVLGLQLTWTIA